ncbi:GNAT family N-acetyltransferase [Agrilactobacillus yilanensis]|uniref:GNAT family N-acetyltransferase n=1 Tax=Agrilactobacillus yilanensis TaxID=2485997 RepID=A0ABW4J5Y3_9LACO|nr:GNAT family N-acetyltransferase [Agrilactobacillus yilanensis]
MFTFRKSNKNDLTAIVEIMTQAKTLLAKRQIPQWQNPSDGPTAMTFKTDMLTGQGYVLCQEEKVVAYGALISGIDPAYEAIDGQWQTQPTSREYIAIHRLCVTSTLKNQGLASEIMQHLITQAIALDYQDIRIDTHRLNLPMQHVIQKNGFQYCGVVKLPIQDGERLAFQLLNTPQK